MDESTQKLELETQYEWSIGLSLLRNEDFQKEEDDDKLHVSSLLMKSNSENHIHTSSSLLDDEHELFSDELCSNDIYANNNFINLSTECSHTSSIYNSSIVDLLRYDTMKTKNPDNSDTSSNGSKITNMDQIFHQNSLDTISNISPASSIKISKKKSNHQTSLKSSNNFNSGKRKKASDYARGILMNWINKNRGRNCIIIFVHTL